MNKKLLYITLAVSAAMIVGLGIYAGTQMFTLLEYDQVEITPPQTAPHFTSGTGVPTTTPEPPPYEEPFFILNSIVLETETTYASFSIVVANYEYVLAVTMLFDVDGKSDSYQILLTSESPGIYECSISIYSFSNPVSHESVISIHLHMIFSDEDGTQMQKLQQNIYQFHFKDPGGEVEDPPYEPVVFLKDSLNVYMVEDSTVMKIEFAVLHVELLTDTFIYFVINGQAFTDESGNELIIYFVVDENGYCVAEVDTTIFPQTENIYGTIKLNYLNEDGQETFMLIKNIIYIVYDENAVSSATTIALKISFTILVIIAIILATIVIIRKYRHGNLRLPKQRKTSKATAKKKQQFAVQTAKAATKPKSKYKFKLGKPKVLDIDIQYELLSYVKEHGRDAKIPGNKLTFRIFGNTSEKNTARVMKQFQLMRNRGYILPEARIEFSAKKKKKGKKK